MECTMNKNQEIYDTLNQYELSENKKTKILSKYRKDHKAEIPINEYIMNSNKVQSFEMKDFQLIFKVFEEVMELIPLSHLPQSLRLKFTECCKKTIRCSRIRLSMWDR